MAIISGLSVFFLLLIIIRRGRRKKTSEEVKAVPYEVDEKFELEGLKNFMSSNVPNELSLEEIEIESEDKPEVDHKSMYEKLKKRYINLEKRYINLEIAFSAVKTRLDHWKQRCIRSEEKDAGYGTDFAAIYQAKGDTKTAALEFMLSLIADTNSIEQGIRILNKPPYPKSVQIGSSIVGLAIVAFFFFNKEAWPNLMQFINTPRNQIFIAGALVVTAVITYYYRRKR